MRTAASSSFFVASVAAIALAAVSLVACAGRVEPGTGGGSSGTSASGGSSGSETSGTGSAGSSAGASTGSSTGGSSAGSSGGSDPDCSAMGVPDIARVCPDGTTVGGSYVLSNHMCVLEFPCPSDPTACEPGGKCNPGTACGGSEASSGCSTFCKCDSTGRYVCEACTAPDPCSQGALCSPGEGCGTAGSSSSGSGSSEPVCSTSCMCDSTGHMQCGTTCVTPPPPPPPDPCAGYSLPNTCEVCSDGTTQCEHFTVINGQCAIEICPGAPTPMMVPTTG